MLEEANSSNCITNRMSDKALYNTCIKLEPHPSHEWLAAKEKHSIGGNFELYIYQAISHLHNIVSLFQIVSIQIRPSSPSNQIKTCREISHLTMRTAILSVELSTAKGSS